MYRGLGSMSFLLGFFVNLSQGIYDLTCFFINTLHYSGSPDPIPSCVPLPTDSSIPDRIVSNKHVEIRPELTGRNYYSYNKTSPVERVSVM